MTTPDARHPLPQGGEGWELILNSVSLYNIGGRRKCRNSSHRLEAALPPVPPAACRLGGGAGGNPALHPKGIPSRAATAHPLSLAQRQDMLSTGKSPNFQPVGKDFTIPVRYFLPVEKGLRGLPERGDKTSCPMPAAATVKPRAEVRSACLSLRSAVRPPRPWKSSWPSHPGHELTRARCPCRPLGHLGFNFCVAHP